MEKNQLILKPGTRCLCFRDATDRTESPQRVIFTSEVIYPVKELDGKTVIKDNFDCYRDFTEYKENFELCFVTLTD